MKRTRLSLVATVLAGIALLTGGAVAATWSTAHAAAPATTYPAGPQGINFTIHTHADPNFCVTNVAVPDLNRETSIQQCRAVDNDDWTFAQSANNSSVLIDGNGQCLGYAGNQQLAAAEPCTFKGAEHFLYNNNTGQITTTNGKFCLQDLQAAADAEVLFNKCQSGLDSQVFVLGH